MEEFKLICGNCYDELIKMNNDSIDHVITSPPYNMNLRIRNASYCSRQIVKEFSTKYEGFSDNLPIDEYYNFHKNVLSELLRVTKKYIFYLIQPITGNKRALFKLIGEFNENLKEIIIWNKGFGQPAMASGVMNSSFEFILIFTKNKKDSISRQFKESNFERGTLSNVWNIKSKKSYLKNHSATSPLELIDNIIEHFTKENEIILDPFLGTGNMGVSTLLKKRKFIGIDIVENYVKESLKRFNDLKK